MRSEGLSGNKQNIHSGKAVFCRGGRRFTAESDAVPDLWLSGQLQLRQLRKQNLHLLAAFT